MLKIFIPLLTLSSFLFGIIQPINISSTPDTLAGFDNNNNNIRDDVEDYINTNYKGRENIFLSKIATSLRDGFKREHSAENIDKTTADVERIMLYDEDLLLSNPLLLEAIILILNKTADTPARIQHFVWTEPF